MRPLTLSQGQTQIFEIRGWHEDAGAQVAVTCSADIATARRLISSQAGQLEKRCAALEKSLRKAGVVDKAVEASKIRPVFDLEIARALEPAPLNWRSSPRASSARREWEKAPGDRSIIDWLSAAAPKNATIVTSSTKPPETLNKQLQSRGFKLIRLHAGEGAAIVSASGNPLRTRPQQGSLAQWLADARPAVRARVSGFVLGSAATAVDCHLLRRRLHPSQWICAELSSEAATELSADWDGRIIEWPGHVLFIEPGLNYLDPALIPPERMSEIDWPKISVVTVSYNQADFLEDCLRSVLEQDYPNLEYIVVDAVSTDGSQDILRRYESRLSKLLIEPDRGQSDGLNKGLNLATGDILTWINSDDMLAPGALRRAALTFLDYGCDLVTGGCERITENSSTVTLRHHPAIPYGRTLPLGFFEHFMWTNSWERGDYFFQPEVLFTADIWRRSGGYLKLHLHWAMDWELWIRMGLAGATIAHIPDTIGRSRAHAAQKTTSEERYLHQLRNILLEHDDALDLLERTAVGLPQGAIPGWIEFDAISRPPTPATAMQRVMALRHPHHLRAALKRRLPPRVVDFLRRLYGLRHPDRLLGAIGRRLPRPLADLLRGLKNLRNPGALRAAVLRRLPPRVKDRLRGAMSHAKYSLSGIRVVSGVRFAELKLAKELLADAERDARAARAMKSELEAQVTQLRLRSAELSQQCIELHDWRTVANTLAAEYSRVSERLERELQRFERDAARREEERERLEVEIQQAVVRRMLDKLPEGAPENGAYREQLKAMLDRYTISSIKISSGKNESLSDWPESDKSGHIRTSGMSTAGSEARRETPDNLGKVALDNISEYATTLLFDRGADPRTRQTMSALLLSGTPVQDALRTIAIQCYDEQSKPAFALHRDLLSRPVPMPLLSGSSQLVNGYTIVDVGAEPLSFESHVYAALPRRRPSLIIGFDPTDKEAPKKAAAGAGDGVPMSEIRTLPHFIGDGNPATFNLARMQPTSSLQKPNLALARHFSLLAEALETVDRRDVETFRLDDILEAEGISDRPIDFLKIDVQGATLPVLHGACQTMARTLVCHLEAEFAELYESEALFADVDRHMRLLGYSLMDLPVLGRQRYNAFDRTDDRFFHAGRLLWADCVYVRHLDEPDQLTDAELLKLAEIAHVVYNKYDVAAFALHTLSKRTELPFYDQYIELWG